MMISSNASCTPMKSKVAISSALPLMLTDYEHDAVVGIDYTASRINYINTSVKTNTAMMSVHFSSEQ